MAWARLDDKYHGHPKITRIFDTNPGALGLYSLLLSYCASYETNGYVEPWQMVRLSPKEVEREQQIADLLKLGALLEHGDGYVVADYLDYNPSREQIANKRDADRLRKAKSRA